MKKGLVLLFVFILAAVFSAEVFAEAQTNFTVKKRDKKVVEQYVSREKIPVVQPVAEATVAAVATVAGTAKDMTVTAYSTVVDNVMVSIGKMKQGRAEGSSDIK